MITSARDYPAASVLSAPEEAGYDPQENIIAGNVAFYGATSGQAYIAGMAGERFAIRNSGATLVVEGVGEHGCEYMTGGTVVVLGSAGKNFAAGMSGGVAFVLDEDNRLYRNLNRQMVRMENVDSRTDREELRRIIAEHVRCTGSAKGKEVLERFAEYVPQFKKIIPHDYAKITAAVAALAAQGVPADKAEIEAFNSLRKEA